MWKDFLKFVSHKLGTGCWYCAFEEAFDSDEIRSFSAVLAGVVDEISSYRDANAVGVGFLFSVIDDYPGVGYRAVGWDGRNFLVS